MSNVGRINNGSQPPPAGYVETLTGNNTGSPVPPLAGNINVIGDGVTINVTGNPATNTLTISSAAATLYTATVIGFTSSPLLTVNVPNNSAVGIFVRCVAARSDFLESLFVSAATGAFTNAFGVTTLQPNELQQAGNINTATLSFILSGNNIVVAAVGQTSDTWRFSAYIQVINQT